MTKNIKYQDIKTWGECETFVKKFSSDDLIKFREALKVVKYNFSLTLRDDFTLTVIESELDKRAGGYK